MGYIYHSVYGGTDSGTGGRSSVRGKMVGKLRICIIGWFQLIRSLCLPISSPSHGGARYYVHRIISGGVDDCDGHFCFVKCFLHFRCKHEQPN